MKYTFQNIIGTFILNDEFKIVATAKDEKANNKLIPPKNLPQVLAQFKDKKYYSEFYQKNLVLTKKEVKDSVSPDQLIMQAISNLSELDRGSNMLSKRLREWYGLYLPELSNKITDHEVFSRLVIEKNKKQLMAELNIMDTIGSDLGKEDVEEIMLLAREISNLYALRKRHEEYLKKIMSKHCPNLLELAGVTIGAKLIELGKGLKRLATMPASTIQLLGAEKALFRHIKTGSKSPKHGIIINHPLIMQSGKDDKGKAARMLADKLSLCARLDYFKGGFKAKEYYKELEEKLK